MRVQDPAGRDDLGERLVEKSEEVTSLEDHWQRSETEFVVARKPSVEKWIRWGISTCREVVLKAAILKTGFLAELLELGGN